MSCRSRAVAGTILPLVVAVQITACATPGFFVVPSVSVDEIYDDNLFFTADGEESDLITRVGPALELGYESDTFSWSGRYRFDAEAYANNTGLNDSQVRRFADIDAEYQPTSRLTLNAAAAYTKTDTPFDLSLVPGGAIPGVLAGRAEAERTSGHVAAGYRLTAPTTGFLAYTRTREDLVGTGESDADALESWFDQRISAVSTLSYGYLRREYRFDRESAQSQARGVTQDSDTPWVGLSHRFNDRTRVSARAGPILDGGSADPYVLLSLQHSYNNGELLLDYERDETTLLGEPGTLEIEAIYATFSRRFGTRLDLQVTPGYAHVQRTGLSVDIYNLGLGVVYKITEAIFLTASYEFNWQETGPAAGGSSDVSRNAIQVGVRLAWPRREPREGR